MFIFHYKETTLYIESVPENVEKGSLYHISYYSLIIIIKCLNV